MAMHRTQRSSDLLWMQRALRLAEGVRGHVWPNPPVGCVIVTNGDVIAEAATHPAGRLHAERKALDFAGAEANGATLYVTLEPCCHWGKTPPCADAIIEAGVSRVVCAIQDPDPRVNGGGFAKLRRAGVEVSVGLGAETATKHMSGFFHRIRTGLPELVAISQGAVGVPEVLNVNAALHETEIWCVSFAIILGQLMLIVGLVLIGDTVEIKPVGNL
jgi:pyrimidine deaminase RibD-like protein